MLPPILSKNRPSFSTNPAYFSEKSCQFAQRPYQFSEKTSHSKLSQKLRHFPQNHGRFSQHLWSKSTVGFQKPMATISRSPCFSYRNHARFAQNRGAFPPTFRPESLADFPKNCTKFAQNPEAVSPRSFLNFPHVFPCQSRNVLTQSFNTRRILFCHPTSLVPAVLLDMLF